MSRSLLAIATLIMLAHAAGAEEFGRFVGRLILSDDDIEDCVAADEDGWYSSFRLVEAFEYIGPDQIDWLVPAGTCVNGASIPAAFWSFMGSPWTGKYRRASVIHDHFVRVRTRPWETTHRAFYYGMLADGVPGSKAKIMYYAVRRFGKRWPEPVRGQPDCGTGGAADCSAGGAPAPEARAVVVTVTPRQPEGSAEAIIEGLGLESMTLDAIDRLADQQLASEHGN